MPSYNRYNRRNTSNGSANNGTPVSLLSEVNANLIANTIKNALPERTTVPNQVAGTVVQGIDEYNKIASGQTNSYKPSYLTDYNDPYAINSFADVLLNRDAKAKRYGDWAKTPIIGDIASTVVGAGDLLWNSTIKPILSGAQYGYEQDGLSGAVSGVGEGLATAGLNALTNLGETMDVVANPVKAVAIEGADALGIGDFGSKYGGDVWQGFKSSLGFGGDGRVNYDWDTGNIISDLALEMISDPLNWISLGASSALKSGSEDFLEQALKEATIPNGSKAFAKEIGKDFAKAYGYSSNDLLSTIGRYFATNSAKNAFSNPKLLNYFDGAIGATETEAIIRTLLDAAADTTLQSTNKMRLAKSAIGLTDAFEKGLLKSVFASSGIQGVSSAFKALSDRKIQPVLKKLDELPEKEFTKVYKKLEDAFSNPKTDFQRDVKEYFDFLNVRYKKNTDRARIAYNFLNNIKEFAPANENIDVLLKNIELDFVKANFPADPVTTFVAKKISPLFKVGYLSSPGFPMRNTIDGLYRNAAQLGGLENLPKVTDDFVKAVQEVDAYQEIALEIQKYIIDHDLKNGLTKEAIQKFYFDNPNQKLSIRDFSDLNRLFNDASGVLNGEVGALKKELVSQGYIKPINEAFETAFPDPSVFKNANRYERKAIAEKVNGFTTLFTTSKNIYSDTVEANKFATGIAEAINKIKDPKYSSKVGSDVLSYLEELSNYAVIKYYIEAMARLNEEIPLDAATLRQEAFKFWNPLNSLKSANTNIDTILEADWFKNAIEPVLTARKTFKETLAYVEDLFFKTDDPVLIAALESLKNKYRDQDGVLKYSSEFFLELFDLLNSSNIQGKSKTRALKVIADVLRNTDQAEAVYRYDELLNKIFVTKKTRNNARNALSKYLTDSHYNIIDVPYRSDLYKTLSEFFETVPQRQQTIKNFRTYFHSKFAEPEEVNVIINKLFNNPVLSVNEKIEQGLRWSMYKQQRALGYTYGEALNRVKDTHFVYSNKTHSLKLIETYFPFTGFTLKNADYWKNMLYPKPLYTFSEDAFKKLNTPEAFINAMEEFKKLPDASNYKKLSKYNEKVLEFAKKILGKADIQQAEAKAFAAHLRYFLNSHRITTVDQRLVNSYLKSLTTPKIYGNYLNTITNIVSAASDLDSLTNPDLYDYENMERDPWSFDPEHPYMYISPSLQYNIMNGNIRFGDIYQDLSDPDQRKYLQSVFKFNPSWMDAFNFMLNPIDSIWGRLLPPFESALAIAKDPNQNPTDDIINSIPILGTIIQRYQAVPNRLESVGWLEKALMLEPSIFGTTNFYPVFDPENLPEDASEQLVSMWYAQAVSNNWTQNPYDYYPEFDLYNNDLADAQAKSEVEKTLGKLYAIYKNYNLPEEYNPYTRYPELAEQAYQEQLSRYGYFDPENVDPGASKAAVSFWYKDYKERNLPYIYNPYQYYPQYSVGTGNSTYKKTPNTPAVNFSTTYQDLKKSYEDYYTYPQSNRAPATEYYTQQRKLNSYARPRNFYKDMYTSTGLSRMKLRVSRVTPKNIQYKVQDIKYGFKRYFRYYY